MDVLILHYHLNPGGVTRIIESQVMGLLATHSSVGLKILCGTTLKLPQALNCEIIQDSLLDYLPNNVTVEELKRLETGILSLIRLHCLPNTIVHAHNSSLGKNPSLTSALLKISTEGVPVINHYHDFAEDRPANIRLLENVIPDISGQLAEEVINPNKAGYHYIVLNSCDYLRLREKGIDQEKIYLLPNPVSGSNRYSNNIADLKNKICRQLDFDPSMLLCTYPVRAIRRKNIGEFILLAALFYEKSVFALTLAPLNPDEIPAYERWKTFCRENSVNVKFEAGERVNFEELLKVSDFCITTSVREGFGMVFMEPWLAGTPVIGRELPCIINDLKKSGMEFPRLYDKLLVPGTVEKADFKELSSEIQENFISAVLKNKQIKDEVFRLNPFLEKLLEPVSGELIRKNQKIIRQDFSIEAYGQQLFGIYSKISR